MAHKAIPKCVTDVLNTCHFDVVCDLLLQTNARQHGNATVLCNIESKTNVNDDIYVCLSSNRSLVRTNQNARIFCLIIRTYTCTATVFNVHLTRQTSFALMLVRQNFLFQIYPEDCTNVQSRHDCNFFNLLNANPDAGPATGSHVGFCSKNLFFSI